MRCFDDSHNHNYTTLPNYHKKVDLGVVAMVVVYFLWLILFVVTMWHRESTCKATGWERRIFRSQLSLDKHH